MNDILWWIIEGHGWPNSASEKYHTTSSLRRGLVAGRAVFFLRNWKSGARVMMGTADFS